MKTKLPDAAIRYWSEVMSDSIFGSPQEARNELFRICERQSRQSWSTPVGKNTAPENRQFANSMPLYRENGQWKVGRPLEEYLSNETSDFSDGTNGEPTAYPPSGGGAGTAVGLPDYKYFERRKNRHDKLKALMQRRDPEGISIAPIDRKLRASIGEDEEDEYEDAHKEFEFLDDEIAPVERLQQHLIQKGFKVDMTEDGMVVTNPSTEHYMTFSDLDSPENIEDTFLGFKSLDEFERQWRILFGDL